MSKVLIHYFSGTGNTKHATEMVKQALEKNGDTVQLHLITSQDSVRLEDFDLHIFAYPVYAMTMPAFFKKYIRRLPKVSGLSAAVLSVCGGDAYQAPEQTRRMLRRKGFKVILTAAPLYPDNWTQIMSPPDEKRAAEMIRTGESQTREFIDRLIKKEESYYKVPSAIGIITWSVAGLFIYLGRFFLGKFFIADSKCNSCGICEKACPVGCIKMVGGKDKTPYWLFKCENCCRCINICPQKAIQFSVFRLLSIGVLAAIFIALIVLFSGLLTPVYAFVPGWIVVVGLVVLAHIAVFAAQIFIVDRLMIALKDVKPFKGWFDWTFTRDYNRYVYPGFKPLAESKNK